VYHLSHAEDTTVLHLPRVKDDTHLASSSCESCSSLSKTRATYNTWSMEDTILGLSKIQHLVYLPSPDVEIRIDQCAGETEQIDIL